MQSETAAVLQVGTCVTVSLLLCGVCDCIRYILFTVHRLLYTASVICIPCCGVGSDGDTVDTESSSRQSARSPAWSASNELLPTTSGE